MKEKVIYVCSECGYESPKWFGRCPVCGAWDSAVKVEKGKGSESPLPNLLKVSLVKRMERLKTGLEMIDSLLGSGFVRGQVILLGGPPGVGKSTLALQLADKLSKMGFKVLYASGEESVEQIGYRAERIGVDSDITLAVEQDIENLLNAAKGFDFLILDSVQTFYSPTLDSPPGTVSQIRWVTSRVVGYSKRTGTVSLLIGHVTKSGDIAGPKVIEHMVDTVLYFEGERATDSRILRVFKNRYGPSGELGIFEMRAGGLVPVEDPIFVDEDLPFGNAVACVLEGSRPFVVQVQALVSRSKMPSPRRTSIGVDVIRTNAIIAVMSKLMKLPLDLHEIYVKILGGMRVTDPGVDLAISAAVLSSFLEKELGPVVFVGEVGLDGKVRVPFGINRRMEVLKKGGFRRVAAPFPNSVEGLDIVEIRKIADILSIMG